MVYVVARLKSLRKSVESETGISLLELEVPFALALVDVCDWLDMSEEMKRSVLGDGLYHQVYERPVPCVPTAAGLVA